MYRCTALEIQTGKVIDLERESVRAWVRECVAAVCLVRQDGRLHTSESLSDTLALGQNGDRRGERSSHSTAEAEKKASGGKRKGSAGSSVRQALEYNIYTSVSFPRMR